MAGDSSWLSVKLLLPCDGADGSTTFTDASNSGHTVTANGNAQIDTAQSKFGGASALFDGTGDYLTIPDAAEFDLTGDFTVECWVRATATGFSGLVGFRDTGDVPPILYLWSSGVLVWYQNSAAQITGTTNIVDAGWTHVAVCRYSGTTKLFVNGTQEGSDYSDATTYSPTGIWIGGIPAASQYLTGHLDDVRVTVGVARYTANFTPPTEAFPTGNPLVPATSTQANSSPIAGVSQNPATIIAAASTQDNQSGDGAVSQVHASLVAAASTEAHESATFILGRTYTLPISIDVLIQVEVGLPITITVFQTPTFTALPITISYPVATTLPIVVRVYQSITAPTLPISIYSSTAASLATPADFAVWKPKCVLDGTDISGQLVGVVTIETEEMAAPVATFSFLPTAGAVDPLAWVGKTVRLSWQQVVAGVVVYEYLRFTGVCSDPSWDVDNRALTMSATGDLQAVFDRMSKAEIDTQLAATGARYSDVVFGDPNDMTGWEYCEANLATTPFVIWQDAGGVPRTTSIAAKVTADYTFTDAGRFGDSAEITYPSRVDMINQVRLVTSYRFDRRRERTVGVSWNYDGGICAYLVIGFELPQRTMIESAASSGGWVVIGDISYVPVWPAGGYNCPTGMDMTGPVMPIGFVNNPSVTDEFAIGASWRASRRWTQAVTENHVLTVNATESQQTVGVLTVDESYAFESEEKDDTWESSLEYTATPAGFSTMANGDEKGDLDGDRSTFEDAQEVALLKAKHDILRSHRGTQFSFETVFQPALDLSHTVHVDCAYVECQGKVSAIRDTWDFDSGDARTQIVVSLSRHNAAGTTSDTTIAATAKPADPDETDYVKNIQLLTHIGGRPYSLVYDEDWTGYITNYTDYGLWTHSKLNPSMAGLWYEESFTVKYPDIDEEYANPIDAAAAGSFEVAVPQDLLTFTS